MFCTGCGRLLPSHHPGCALDAERQSADTPRAGTTTAEDPPSRLSTGVSAAILGPFGAIWARRNADEAARLGYSRRPYWRTFWLSWLCSWIVTSSLLVLVPLLVLGAILHGTQVTSSSAALPEASAFPSATTTPLAAGRCAYSPTTGKASRAVSLPPEAPPVNGTRTVTMMTSQGVIAWTLATDRAPCASNSIATLAAQGFYDGTPCHRLTTQGIFVLQCGDPSGTGSGGPGYAFADENLTGATYPRGTVAMANSGPDTNGGQFFLVYKDADLPPKYTPVGTISSGFATLDKIAAAGSDPPGDGKPRLSVSIEKFTVK